MSNSSVFDYSGSIERISIRVQLYQTGIPSLDFDKFTQNEKLLNEKAAKTKIDDTNIGWRQTITKPTTSSSKRIFTVNDENDLPEHLKQYGIYENKEEAINMDIKEKEIENNEHVIYRKTYIKRPKYKNVIMYILGKLGPSGIDDPRGTVVIARITMTDNRRLTVEPAMDYEKGIHLESRFGDFEAIITFSDVKEKDEEIEYEGIGERHRGSRPSITSMPEADHFSTATDGLIESAINVNLVSGHDFLFDDGITIDYKLRLPSGVSLKSDNITGRTQRFSADPNGIIHFSQLFEFVFEYKSDQHLPLLMLRLFSVDYWGRQYIAGYGSVYLTFEPGRNKTNIYLWRPVDNNDLHEFFVGQSIDIDYYGINETDKHLRNGINGEPSGVIRIEYDCISQSRLYMASDILHQITFGTRMAEMGLRSDFYQRIMKVLMEFQDARKKLMLARAMNKKKIKQ